MNICVRWCNVTPLDEHVYYQNTATKLPQLRYIFIPILLFINVHFVQCLKVDGSTALTILYHRGRDIFMNVRSEFTLSRKTTTKLWLKLF